MRTKSLLSIILASTFFISQPLTSFAEFEEIESDIPMLLPAASIENKDEEDIKEEIVDAEPVSDSEDSAEDLEEDIAELEEEYTLQDTEIEELSFTELNQQAGEYVISASGNMPLDAVLNVSEVYQTEELEEVIDNKAYTIAAAFDIEIISNGEVWQPIDHDQVITITASNIEIPEEENLKVYRIEEETSIPEIVELDAQINTNNEVIVETDHFTIYTFGGVAIEGHETAAYLLKGDEFNIAIKHLVDPSLEPAKYNGYYGPTESEGENYNDSTITDIEWTTTDLSADAEAINISTDGEPVYAKLNGTVIDLFTAAEDVYFNADCQTMFSGFTALQNISFLNDKINTSLITNAQSMFGLANYTTYSKCDDTALSSLQELNLSRFETSNITDMSYMINCGDSWLGKTELYNLDLSTFEISEGTDTTKMIEGYLLHTIKSPKAIPEGQEIEFPYIPRGHTSWYLDDAEPELEADNRTRLTICIAPASESHTYIESHKPGFSLPDASTTFLPGSEFNAAIKGLASASDISEIRWTKSNLTDGTVVSTSDSAYPTYAKAMPASYTITGSSIGEAASHSSNINDTQEAQSKYANGQRGNDMVTIPGAEMLHITINHGIAVGDYLAVFEGEYEYAVSSTLKESAVYIFDDSVTSTDMNSYNTVDFYIPGDTASFVFYSDYDGVAGYGYYATVEGYCMSDLEPGDGAIILLSTEAEDIYFNTDCSSMFSGFSVLKSMDIFNNTRLGESQITNISEMFKDCESLTMIPLVELTLNNISGSAAQNVFENCTSLCRIAAQVEGDTEIELYTSDGDSWTLFGDNTGSNQTVTAINTSGMYIKLSGTVLMPGRAVNALFKILSANEIKDEYAVDNTITKITVVTEDVGTYTNYPNIAIDGKTPVYVVPSETSGNLILTLHTAASTIALNQDSSMMFYNMKALSDIETFFTDRVRTNNCEDYSHMFENSGVNIIELEYWQIAENADITDMLKGADNLQYISVSDQIGFPEGYALALPQVEDYVWYRDDDCNNSADSAATYTEIMRLNDIVPMATLDPNASSGGPTYHYYVRSDTDITPYQDPYAGHFEFNKGWICNGIFKYLANPELQGEDTLMAQIKSFYGEDYEVSFPEKMPTADKSALSPRLIYLYSLLPNDNIEGIYWSTMDYIIDHQDELFDENGEMLVTPFTDYNTTGMYLTSDISSGTIRATCLTYPDGRCDILLDPETPSYTYLNPDSSKMFFGLRSVETIELFKTKEERTSIEWNDKISEGMRMSIERDYIPYPAVSTTDVLNYNEMFMRCDTLDLIDISNFDMSKAESCEEMFAYCTHCTQVILPSSLTFMDNEMFSFDPALSLIYGGENVERLGERVFSLPEGKHSLQFADYEKFVSTCWFDYNWENDGRTVCLYRVTIPALANGALKLPIDGTTKGQMVVDIEKFISDEDVYIMTDSSFKLQESGGNGYLTYMFNEEDVQTLYSELEERDEQFIFPQTEGIYTSSGVTANETGPAYSIKEHYSVPIYQGEDRDLQISSYTGSVTLWFSVGLPSPEP